VAAVAVAVAVAGNSAKAIFETTPQPPPSGGGFLTSRDLSRLPQEATRRYLSFWTRESPLALPAFNRGQTQLETRESPGLAAARFSAARRMPLIIPRKTMPWKGNTEYQYSTPLPGPLV
jgi:hypothetical protein